MTLPLADTWQQQVVQIIWGVVLLAIAYIANGVRQLHARRSIKSLRVEDGQWADQKIHDIVAALRERFDADRAYLSRFHNGDHYIDDSELLRKTRTHESVKDGLAYQSELYKGILLSSLPDEVRLAIDAGPSFFVVRDLPRGKFKWLCMQGGVRAGARAAVRKGGKIVGFVGVDFASEERPADVDAVVEFAGRIESLI